VRNLGDKVHKVMRVSGVHQITEAIINKTGKECGCKKRQADLNKWSNKVMNKVFTPKK